VLDYLLRFIVTILIITGIAFLIPTLVIFFLQVLITVSVFLVILFVLSLFYKGDKDESE
jgi:maltodextrin utilization protein YvdJ